MACQPIGDHLYSYRVYVWGQCKCGKAGGAQTVQFLDFGSLSDLKCDVFCLWNCHCTRCNRACRRRNRPYFFCDTWIFLFGGTSRFWNLGHYRSCLFGDRSVSPWGYRSNPTFQSVHGIGRRVRASCGHKSGNEFCHYS